MLGGVEGLELAHGNVDASAKCRDISVGRAIVETLEKDEFFVRAKRIEIPASITGVPFYLKMGYDYKNGITTPDEEHLIRLEKHKEIR